MSTSRESMMPSPPPPCASTFSSGRESATFWPLSNTKTIINVILSNFPLLTGTSTWTSCLECYENKLVQVLYTYNVYLLRRCYLEDIVGLPSTNVSCLNVKSNYTLAIIRTILPPTDLVDLLGVVLSSFFPESTEGTTKSFSLGIFSLPVH